MTKQEQRTMLAGMAMQGMLANDFAENRPGDSHFSTKGCASLSVEYADELLAELERTARKEEPPKYRPHPFSPSISRNNPTP